jgi:hypothetical protein
VILKVHSQVGWRPRFSYVDELPEPLYPRFVHATDRL